MPRKVVNIIRVGNIDSEVVEGFGEEWSRYSQEKLSARERAKLFDEYFGIFPWDTLPPDPVGFDLGCGSGRWAMLVAPRVGELHLIDASDGALKVAKRNLASYSNCNFHQAAVDSIPLSDESCDFGYSLGVLHHVPDTEAGVHDCVRKLKKGAPFLLYLYYAFDNRPFWYRWLWKVTDLFRRGISSLPFGTRSIITNFIAIMVYWPFARTSKLLDRAGVDVRNFPLSQYRTRSLYVMQTDALDRFGTRLEKRFSRNQIERMMVDAGLVDIRFSDQVFWTAVGIKDGPPK